MSTHLAAQPGQIAPRVLLPGDPLRARWIAETFLDDATAYSTVRNMLGFTGTYRGEPISVQGSGMGQPSLAIYVHELFTEYDVAQVVRVGSCGALSPELELRDLVLAISAATDSAMNRIRFEGLDFAATADFDLLRAAHDQTVERGASTAVGQVLSTDSFYSDRPDLTARLGEYGVVAVEMEANALYTLAAKHRRRALTICTVSDHIQTGSETTAHEREQTFGEMVQIALEAMLAVPLVR
ncbi:MAG: purine-nucleoside phosphorylase [Nocardioidaceae bacterium]